MHVSALQQIVGFIYGIRLVLSCQIQDVLSFKQSSLFVGDILNIFKWIFLCTIKCDIFICWNTFHGQNSLQIRGLLKPHPPPTHTHKERKRRSNISHTSFAKPASYLSFETNFLHVLVIFFYFPQLQLMYSRK